ncbi:MAG: TetR/AcrR family transcriptional regulator [Syntrophobacteria bacterium]
MAEATAKKTRLDQHKRETLSHLLLQGGSADPAAWDAFWRSVSEYGNRADGEQLEVLTSIFEEGVSLTAAADPGERSLLGRWIREVIRAAQSWGIDQGDFIERLVSRQVAKQVGQRDQGRPQSCSTHGKILAAALEVFSAKGFHGATVDEIAEHAGLGKGTVYRHFDSKKRLFSQLILSKVAELEQTVSGAIDPEADVLEIIETYLKVYFAFFDRNRKLYRVLVQEQSDFGAEVKGLYIGNILKKVPLLKRKIYQAASSGQLKEMNFHTVFYGVMGFIDGVMQKWLASEVGYSLVDELPTVLETIFYGFVNRSSLQASADNERDSQSQQDQVTDASSAIVSGQRSRGGRQR